MTLLETIRAMWREFAYVASFLCGVAGVTMIAEALGYDPTWPVLVLFFGFCVIMGVS